MKKLLCLLILGSFQIQSMKRELGQELDEREQLTEAIDKHGSVLVKEHDLVAVKRLIDKKYRLGQVRLMPCATSQFIGLASFNADVTSSHLSFAVNFKTKVRRLSALVSQDQNEPKIASKTN